MMITIMNKASNVTNTKPAVCLVKVLKNLWAVWVYMFVCLDVCAGLCVSVITCV